MKCSLGMAGARVGCGEGENQSRESEVYHVQKTDACGSDRINAVGDARSSWRAPQYRHRHTTLRPTAEAGVCGPGSSLRRSRSGPGLHSARSEARVCATVARSGVCPACPGPCSTIIWASHRMDQEGCANEKDCEFSCDTGSSRTFSAWRLRRAGRITESAGLRFGMVGIIPN